MRRFTIILSFILLITNLIIAQPQAPDTLWTRNFGGYDYDRGNCVLQTQDGGFIIAGTTGSFGLGYSDLWLIKTDNDGNEQWSNTYGGLGEESGSYILQNEDGSYTVLGNTSGGEEGDIWVFKTDPNGVLLWDMTYGDDYLYQGKSIQHNDNGSYIITGYTYNSGDYDAMLVKIGANGFFYWSRTFDNGNEDFGESGQQTNDGGYIMVGTTYSYDPEQSDIWLIKTDIYGNMLWDKTYGGTGYDCGYSILENEDGSFIIAGSTNSFNALLNDVWLIKTDSLGNIIWDRIIGGDSDDYGRSVQQTDDGGYIITGSTNSFGAGTDDIYVIKTDSLGIVQWTQTYGGYSYENGKCIQQTDNGGYIITGYTNTFSFGHEDAYIICLNSENSTVENYDNRTPMTFNLFSIFPNPFNNSTTISFTLPASGELSLKVYDISGREVQDLGFGIWDLGTHSVVWDAKSQASGIYFVRLEAGSYVKTEKIVLVK